MTWLGIITAMKQVKPQEFWMARRPQEISTGAKLALFG